MIAPTKAPTPCRANPSTGSSYLKIVLSEVAKLHTMAATKPTAKAEGLPMYPAAGVTAMRPASTPLQKETAE